MRTPVSRITAGIACLLVAMDCLFKASGRYPQELFNPESIWVWSIAALFWVIISFRVFLAGAK